LSLAPGDVVVMGSDGLFDNLFDEEIAAIVADALPPSAGSCSQQAIQRCAQRLVEAARDCSMDEESLTPWSERQTQLQRESEMKKPFFFRSKEVRG
jgi:protein phosphatase PTC7